MQKRNKMFSIKRLKINITYNLSSLYKKCLTLLIFTLPFTSHAIIIRDDVPDQHYRDLANSYSASVAYLDKCVATVLSKYWLITAGHCVSAKNNYPLRIDHLGVNYPVEKIIETPNNQKFNDTDIALLKLKWPLENAKPVMLYTKDDELGKTVVFVGKGFTGNGLTGDKTRDNIERAAMNTVSNVDKNWLNFSFNIPKNALELEGVSGSEDSGGPAFIISEQGIQLAGVGCCQVPVIKDNQELQGGYLSTEYYTRLSTHKNWIEKIINVGIISKPLKSPIVEALKYNKIETAKSLLKIDKTWLKDSETVTDILTYSFFRSNELSYYLLTTYPELHTHKINGLPLTAFAYLQGNSVVFSLLIKLGVAMDYSGFRGQQLPSLITWQYFNDDYNQQIKLLLQQGLEINHFDEHGDTALHMAVYWGWIDRVAILIDSGANIHQTDYQGNTALIDAAKMGNVAMVEQLLVKGANIKHTNKAQKDAMMIAEAAGHKKLVSYLRSKYNSLP